MNRYFRTLIGVLLLISFCASSHAKMNHRHLAKQDWITVSSDNVTIVTDAEAEVGIAMAEQLERFRYFVAHYLGEGEQLYSPKIKVFALSSEKSYNALDMPKNLAGLFQTTSDGSFAVANVSGFSTNPTIQTDGNQVILHEYVHYASRTLFGKYNYPSWYSEGVAEYLATFRELENGTYFSVGSVDIIGKRTWSIRKSSRGLSFELLDIEDLFKSSGTDLSWRDEKKGKKRSSGGHTAKFYARSVMAYHYLQSTPALRQQLKTYIELTNKGHSIDSAFDIAFNGISYAGMDIAMNEYMSTKNGMQLQFFEVDFPTFPTTVTELDADAAHIDIVNHLVRVHDKPVEKRLETIKRVQEDHPYDPSLAYSELVLMQYQGYDDYVAALQRAAEFYPDHTPIKVLMAEYEANIAKYHIDTGSDLAAAKLKTLRNTLRVILNQDPTHTRAYAQLAELSSNNFETSSNLVKEACIAGESLRLLASDSSHHLRNEIECRVLQKEIETATLLLRKLDTNGQNEWISTGYGRFILDALNMREVALSEPETSTAMELQYPDGAYYYGDIVDDKPHGRGTFTSANESIAEGYWHNGMLVTADSFTASNGYRYTGEYLEGTISGKGTLYFPDGEIQKTEGQFAMGFAHGQQIETYQSGLLLKGRQHLNQRLGTYHVTLPDGSSDEVEMIRHRAKVETSPGMFFIAPFKANGYFKGNGMCYKQEEQEVYGCGLNNPPTLLLQWPQ